MKKVLNLIFISLCCSCNNITEQHLSNKTLFIEDSIFINVLADIHIVEAAKHLNYIPYDTNASTIPDYYNLIFKNHHISLEEFLSTYNYNLSDPTKMEKILAKVIQKIEQKEIDLLH